MQRFRGAAFFAAGAAAALAGLIVIESAGAVPSSYSPYRKLKTFARVLTYVENNYVSSVDGNKLIHGAIRGMLRVLDPHSAFMTPEQYRQMKADTQGEFGGLGIEVEIRDSWLTVVAPLHGTPAHRAGLEPNDRIVSIEGTSTKGMTMDQAVHAMRGPRGTRVKLRVRRSGKKELLTFEIVRDVIKIVSVSHKMLEQRVGYIRVKTFQDRTAASLRQALDQMRAAKGGLDGLVLDLRGNPGGLLAEAVRVADLFISEGLIVKTTGKAGRVLDRETAHQQGTYVGFPIVCLVSGGTASASEIVAGALQDHKRAVVLGTQTFGKGSVQTIIELNDGSGLKLTVARYFTPKGRSIQEHGIAPDIIVQTKAPPKSKEKVRREADLANHLRNAQKPNKRPARLKDFQLQTALDYLRAARIFGSQRG